MNNVARKIIIFALLAFSSFYSLPLYGGEEIGRYEVIPGQDENAYLVDTKTGFVWILTYRNLPTGREPVAIPYKFIVISPQNQGNFLVESVPMVAEPKKEEIK